MKSHPDPLRHASCVHHTKNHKITRVLNPGCKARMPRDAMLASEAQRRLLPSVLLLVTLTAHGRDTTYGCDQPSRQAKLSTETKEIQNHAGNTKQYQKYKTIQYKTVQDSTRHTMCKDRVYIPCIYRPCATSDRNKRSTHDLSP